MSTATKSARLVVVGVDSSSVGHMASFAAKVMQEGKVVRGNGARVT